MATTTSAKQKVEKAEGGIGHVWYSKSGVGHIEIVSVAPYPLLIPIYRTVGNAEIQAGVVKLMPGLNMVPEDDWNSIRDLELIKKRLDERWLQPGKLDKRHKYELSETNKARMIEEHCAKATNVKFADDLELSSDMNLQRLTQG